MNEQIPYLSNKGAVFRSPQFKGGFNQTLDSNIGLNPRSSVLTPKLKIDLIMFDLASKDKEGIKTPPFLDR